LLNKGAIFMAVKDEQTLEMWRQRNLPEALLQSCAILPFGKCLCGRAAATAKLFFSTISMTSMKSAMTESAAWTLLHPIMSEGQLLGVLNAYVAAGHVSDESEEKFLKTVADTLAVVIERKLTEEKLQLLAITIP